MTRNTKIREQNNIVFRSPFDSCRRNNKIQELFRIIQSLIPLELLQKRQQNPENYCNLYPSSSVTPAEDNKIQELCRIIQSFILFEAPHKIVCKHPYWLHRCYTDPLRAKKTTCFRSSEQ